MNIFTKVLAAVPILLLGASMPSKAQFNPVNGYDPNEVIDKLYVINAGGGYIVDENTKQMFDFNIGEPITETFDLQGYTLTQGFLQPIFVDFENNTELPYGPIYVNQDVSPNGDGKGHDRLTIDNIDKYPSNRMTVYNRWQSLVFDTRGYDNNTNYFDGSASQKSNTQFYVDDKPVPDGTYYYTLEIMPLRLDGKPAYSKPVVYKGYFVLKRK